MQWLLAAAGVWWLTTRCPGQPSDAWLDSLMLRGYAADHLRAPADAESPEAFEAASAVAQHTAVPIGWAIYLQDHVVPERLAEAATAARAHYLAGGPPAQTTPEALQARKEAALQAAIAGVMG